MTPIRRREWLGAAAAVALPGLAWSQAYPSRPLRWIVGTAPGGAADGNARIVSAQLGRQLQQQVIVDNKPGGAGILSVEALRAARPDGYTLLQANNGVLVYNVALFKSLPYDPRKDLLPIGLLSRIPLVILTNANSRYANIAQLVDAIRKQPDAINYASPGIGTPHHLAMEMLKHKAQLKIVDVQYNGGGKVLQDMLGGQIDLTVLDVASASAMLKAGKLRALATFSKTRLASMPDVPSLMELGYTDLETVVWQGLVVAQGTPPDIQERLNRELRAALADPAVAARLADIGADPAPMSIAETRAYMDAESGYWIDLIRRQKISVS